MQYTTLAALSTTTDGHRRHAARAPSRRQRSRPRANRRRQGSARERDRTRLQCAR
jgi:hypothetical protein